MRGRVASLLTPWCVKGEVPKGVNLNQYAGDGSCIPWHCGNERLFGFLSVRLSLQNMAGEELAHHVVGNDSGLYNAGFAGDDAPRAVPSDARHDGWYGPEGRKQSGITHSTTNSRLRLKSVPFCPRAHDADHV